MSLFPFSFCFDNQQRGLSGRCVGIFKGGLRGVGPLTFLDLSLIGKWKRFNVSFK